MLRQQIHVSSGEGFAEGGSSPQAFTSTSRVGPRSHSCVHAAFSRGKDGVSRWGRDLLLPLPLSGHQNLHRPKPGGHIPTWPMLPHSTSPRGETQSPAHPCSGFFPAKVLSDEPHRGAPLPS